ncbi:MAG: hypothetical protein ACKVU4_07705 [Phycisphaerales bacterium]
MTRAALHSMLAAALLAGGLGGCAGGGSGARRSSPYQPMDESARDPRAADALNARAVALMGTDPAEAEKLLREALTADLFHAPAHNNLGTIYLGRSLYYAAASEFSWAAKLAPDHPDPRLNLALTLERAGRTNDALTAYASTLEAHPEHLPTMQAMARLQVRSDRTDERTPRWLDEIVMRSDAAAWRDWAARQLTRLPR